ncbi:hypothetical protein [Flavonifractor plautii]|uniref:Uncharacterized protein n=1 Tax=Flavonifractor plautii TaxID=292800 RepID=A0A6I2R7P3_FLAPL|nr:hypothetical protein [Flavonifractor plautii]MSB19737.1 hypothetical protein [Flavonifractor plautii]MSB83363.1 hypothetical protein [Flavonifractor plautii]
MKRALIQSVKVTPYTSEDAINREGFLSGILAVKVGSPTGSPTGLAVKLTITESDQSGSGYAPVKDKLVCVGNAPLDDAGAISVTTDAAGGELVNFDLDLVGLKQYVKVKVEVTCTGGDSASCEAAAALALGDASEVPV